jgi:osmotically-inducible protein OsmY
MNDIRKFSPGARTKAETTLLIRLAEIGLLASIRRCEALACVPSDRRFHHRPTAATSAASDSAGDGTELERAALPFPSDKELAESARMALARRAAGSAAQVTVTVTNGWLILDGEVETPAELHDIEAAAQAMNGISGISNRVVLVNEALARRAHQTIIEAFVSSARQQAYRVQVVARDQTIVLSGCTRTAAERDQAVAAAWKVPGAEAVENHIRLGPGHAANVVDVALFH